MSLFRKNTDEGVKVISPTNFGLLEKKLSDKEMNYLWRCIDNSEKSYKKRLAGQIHESKLLNDKSDWFFNNTLTKMCRLYGEEFGNLGKNIPTNQNHPYYMNSWWVNYQKQNEFNPLHDHSGIYSFIVWMKIPTNHDEQNRNPLASRSNIEKISVVDFLYSNILGRPQILEYRMNPDMEGTMLFFPSLLRHQVYPFYNCDEDRISISGNIMLNTAKTL